MDIIPNSEYELLLKEQRIQFWEDFGIVANLDELKENFNLNREVAV